MTGIETESDPLRSLHSITNPTELSRVVAKIGATSHRILQRRSNHKAPGLLFEPIQSIHDPGEPFLFIRTGRDADRIRIARLPFRL